MTWGRGTNQGTTGPSGLRGGSHLARRGRLGAVPACAWLLGSAWLCGCESTECEQARLDLAGAWEELRDTATSRQQIPPASDLSKSEQDERIRVWTDIEARAELLRSSFGTPQVTWSPAQKARADLGRLFAPVEKRTDDPVIQGFATALASADQRMARYDETCR